MQGCERGERQHDLFPYVDLKSRDEIRALIRTERDSKKDEAVIFIFIFVTGGLLAWAACKPWIERYAEVGSSWRAMRIGLGLGLGLTTHCVQAARERRSYMPVAEDRM